MLQESAANGEPVALEVFILSRFFYKPVFLLLVGMLKEENSSDAQPQQWQKEGVPR